MFFQELLLESVGIGLSAEARVGVGSSSLGGCHNAQARSSSRCVCSLSPLVLFGLAEGVMENSEGGFWDQGMWLCEDIQADSSVVVLGG